jgi:hypothetical protein
MSIPAKVALKEMVKGKTITKPDTRHEMLEVGRRLINKKAKDVIEETLRIALDSKHPDQMTALKLLMGRVAPQTFYEKLADKAGAGNKVNIQINVVGQQPEKVVEDAIIVEVKDVKPEAE